MKEKLMWVLWPSFLAAGVFELVIFSLVDPADLHGVGGGELGLSRTGVYTLAFFFFWGVLAACSAMSIYLANSPFEVKDFPRRHDGRPDDESGASHGARFMQADHHHTPQQRHD
jgi:hypothetical protein